MPFSSLKLTDSSKQSKSFVFYFRSITNVLLYPSLIEFCVFQLKDWRMIQEEQAERFYRSHTLRRFLMVLLDHVTEEKLLEWDRLELAQEHNKRSATCDVIWMVQCVLPLI